MRAGALLHIGRERFEESGHWLKRHTFLHGFGILLLTAAGLTVWAKIFERIVPTVENGWAIYWPYNGIIVAFLLMSKRRWWPWILAGFVCAFVRIELVAHDTVGELTVDIASNLVEIAVAALALPPFRSLKQWMMEPKIITRFALYGILLGPLLTCGPVAWYFSSRFPGTFWENVVLWSFSDALGAALWTPLILVLFSRETYDLFRRKAIAETVGLMALLYCVCVLTFHQNYYQLGFLPYPVLLFMAYRLGFSGAVISVNMLTLIAASFSLHGFGPFRAESGVWNDAHSAVVQVFATLAMLFVFPFSVKLMERRNFEERLTRAYAEMTKLATIDKLTEVANRRHFDEMLESAWERALRSREAIGLLMVDADCFKAYNDLYGHVAGDACLRQIAATLQSESLQHGDLIARYGGEEFAVLLPRATKGSLREVAERLRTKVVAAEIKHEGNPHKRVTISIGCAFAVPRQAAMCGSLVAAADEALYIAKHSGRNCIRIAWEEGRSARGSASETIA
jgi:diguanylate cyclase (GGDEF)-like protein